jgi:hypothetical protein
LVCVESLVWGVLCTEHWVLDHMISNYFTIIEPKHMFLSQVHSKVV